MRQIITPLPKVAERQKSTSPSRSKPSETLIIPGDLPSETPVPRRHSLATTSLLREGDPPPQSADTRRLELSYPILSATGQRRETPASYEPIPSAAVDPSTLTSFATPMPHGLSSSPVSFNSYSVAMTNGIDQTRATTMIMLTEDESRFVGFFLRELPSMLPFTQLFPLVCNDIWAMSLTSIPLTQSILAVSSYLADRRAETPPIRSLTYLENALTRIQEAISVGIVDEGLIAAVFLLAFLSTHSADYKSSRRHLQGMAQLLQFYHQRRACCIPPSPSPYHTNGYAIVMLLWRMAIRMEYHVDLYKSGRGAPIFPVVNTSQESTHVEWISEIIDKTIPNGLNWALASFGLDDLMNRASHLSYDVAEQRFRSRKTSSSGRASASRHSAQPTPG